MRIMCGVLGLLGLLYAIFCGYVTFHEHASSGVVEIEMLIAAVVAVAGIGLAGVMDAVERAGKSMEIVLLRQMQQQMGTPPILPPTEQG